MLSRAQTPWDQLEDSGPLLDRIQELSLGVGRCIETNGVPVTLGTPHRMHNLKHLKIYPANSEIACEFGGWSYWSLQELMGSSSPTWPRLFGLTLSGCVTGADYLLDFLQKQPALRQITLSGVKLVQGSWKSTVDNLRKSLILTEARIQRPLIEHIGGYIFSSEDIDQEVGFSNAVERYLLDGGENPLEKLWATDLGPAHLALVD